MISQRSCLLASLHGLNVAENLAKQRKGPGRQGDAVQALVVGANALTKIRTQNSAPLRTPWPVKKAGAGGSSSGGQDNFLHNQCSVFVLHQESAAVNANQASRAENGQPARCLCRPVLQDVNMQNRNVFSVITPLAPDTYIAH